MTVASRIVFSWLALVSCLFANSLARGESISVELASGRTYRGVVTERTDEAALWFQYGTERFQVTRSIAWSRVVSARVGGKSVSGTGLKRMSLDGKFSPLNQSQQGVRQSSEKLSAASFSNSWGDAIGNKQDNSAVFHTAKGRYFRGAKGDYSSANHRRIFSVRTSAQLANWDSDSLPDGLTLFVMPLDGNDQLVATAGVVQVELLSYVKRNYGSLAYGNGGEPRRIGYWSIKVDQDQTTTQGIKVRLPFQSFDPSRDSRISHFGILRVKWVAPGSGLFEAEELEVRIKRF